jgi:hypothetical protein
MGFQANDGLVIGGGERFLSGHGGILTELRNERKGIFSFEFSVSGFCVGIVARKQPG